LSWWLNATGAPGEIAARAGNCVRVLQHVYTHCIDGGKTLSASRPLTRSTRTPAPHHIVDLLVETFRILIQIIYVERVGLEPTTGGL
jgi:hypothetical protein